MAMKKVLSFVTLITLAILPFATSAQSTMMSTSMIGVGAHGYDWLLGTWTCTNSMPSAMSPATMTSTFSRSSAGGVLLFRGTGKNVDSSGYIVYVPKTKTWMNPFVAADGSYGSESTIQTGKKAVWTGTVYASGKTTPVRDTYVALSLAKWTEVSEYQSGGTWKTAARSTCTKS